MAGSLDDDLHSRGSRAMLTRTMHRPPVPVGLAFRFRLPMGAPQVGHGLKPDAESLDGGSPVISVIIPTLNEPEAARRAVLSAGPFAGTEVIVVQGAVAGARPIEGLPAGVVVTASPPGRARQMNDGARLARGEILLFLHADTQLPAGYDAMVRQALDQPSAIAGAFSLRIDGRGMMLRLIERAVAFRSRVAGFPYGDQALFLRKAVFDELGGFPTLPIMEDFEFVRTLRRRGRIHTLAEPVLTSAARWDRLGAIRTTLLNQAFIAAHLCGVSSDSIARWYHRGRSSAAP